MSSDWRPSPHPVLKLPTRKQALAMGEAALWKLLQDREELIAREKEDPLRHGFEPSSWALADAQLGERREILILGGNRSAKSEYAAKRVVQKLVSGEHMRAWCFQTSEANSVEMQQSVVWKYLPREWKGLRKGTRTNISYSQKNGFSENTFVGPNGSQCFFRNYMQDISTIEGGEVDVIWADELVPLDWLETMRYRLVTRGGILIVTFTPVQGYNATVRDYLSGAKTLEELPAPLLADADGKVPSVPRIQQPVRQGARILYFHTSENPWSGYVHLAKTLAGATRVEILCRAYGVPTKAIANRFPKFGKAHVIRGDQVPTVGTRYHFVDPCSGRNWLMGWVLVDARGHHFVYREWPCAKRYIEGVGYPGAWAEPDGRKLDGKRGPAQQPFGFGLQRYKSEILALEKDEEIFERRMDSRFGAAPTLAKENPTTLIEQMEELDLSFLPTAGDTIDEGVELINTLLDYDPAKPVDATNEPKLYVSEECENFIYSLHEWTGADGQRGACKDPVDLLRYMALGDLQDVGPGGKLLATRGGGSY